MKYPYNKNYSPSFSALEVVLLNNEDGLQTSTQPALLDTGADGTLVPLPLLKDILAPVLSDTHIRSHWGEWRAVQLFLVDVEINGLILPNVFVVGDEQDDEIILGRNVLNKLRLTFDGPANLTNVPAQ